jgi:Tfp pilus assembly protein PilO
MTSQLVRMRERLGGLGLASLALLAALGVFHLAVLDPLRVQGEAMKQRVARQSPAAAPAQPASAAEQVSAVYAFLKRDAQTTDWLAKLHAIGAATGVELKSASYRTQQGEGRILRYEIVLPMAGSYPQIREFLQRSAAEIPVMSIDQVTLRRDSREDPALQAELRLTLHMVKS